MPKRSGATNSDGDCISEIEGHRGPQGFRRMKRGGDGVVWNMSNTTSNRPYAIIVKYAGVGVVIDKLDWGLRAVNFKRFKHDVD